MAVYTVGKSLLHLSLEKALAIAQDGDTLLLKEGEYWVTGSHAKSLTVQAAQPNLAPVVHGQWQLTGGDWTFRGLRLQHDAETTVLLQGASATIENCHLYSAQKNAIYALQDAEQQQTGGQQKVRVSLQAVTFGPGAWPALYLNGSQAQLDNCEFQTTDTNAVNVKNGGAASIVNTRFAPSSFPLLYAEAGSRMEVQFCQFTQTASNSLALAEAAQATVSDCHFSGYAHSKHTVFSVVDRSQITITRCTFEQLERQVLYIKDSSAQFDGCEFQNVSQSPVITGYDSSLSASECMFGQIERNSVSTHHSQLSLTACTFEAKAAGYPSLACEGGKAQLQGCTFLEHHSNGISAKAGCELSASECEWQGAGKFPQVFLKESQAKLISCTFSGSKAMVYAEDASASVAECSFDHIENDSPLHINRSQVTATNCTFGTVSGFYTLFAAGEGAKLSVSGSDLIGRKFAAKAVKGAQIDLTGSTFDDSALKEDSGGSILYPGRVQKVTAAPPTAKATPQVPTSKTQPLPELLEEGIGELNALIGLSEVKDEVKKLVALVRLQQRREQQGLPSAPVTLHLVFTGNPGTGKTTVARIIGRIYRGLGLLSSEKVIETDRSGLVGEYIGHTAGKTQDKINEALDGILFIDEAYSLVVKETGNDFGREAIDTLLKQMEDNRHRLAVIVAGYTGKMQEFMASNPGLASRFTRTIQFADYSPAELLAIFEKLCQDNAYRLSDEARNVLTSALEQVYTHRDQHFGNGRDVRTLFEKAVEQHALRVSEDLEADLSLFERADIDAALQSWKRA